ncbi:MAG: hypothetical protein RR539_09520 [Clostridium sp.]|uniref:YkvI family membrane protein n=1 Tax=Clostridium sp. TaxID=1506 RepID=UPI002FC5C175
MGNDKVRIKMVITFAGAVIAFLIGSGFATGQEVLQYFASYGYLGIAGALLTLVLLVYVCSSFITVGQSQNFEKGSDIYSYYCGKKLGKFFDYFSTLFCFLSFTVMVSGAGATLNQHYELHPMVGGLIIAALVLITVLMGLNKIVDIIGKIGPLIVVISILLGLYSIFKNMEYLDPSIVASSIASLTEGGSLITASSTWYFAAFSYVGFCMLWLAAFLAAMGTRANSKKEAICGGAAGAVAFSVAVMIVALGLMACINSVAGSQIPMLYLAKDIAPFLGTVFAVIIMAGIYTTAVPLMFNVVSRFTKEGTKKFKISTIVLVVVGAIVGLLLPFAKLVNVVYVINGYVGAVLLAIMLGRSIYNYINKKKSLDIKEDTSITP